MAKHLNQTGLQWEGTVDGPFPARITTDCESVNDLLRAAAQADTSALSAMLEAVEKVVGKLTKHRRAKLKAAFVSSIATLSGEAWMYGAKAAQAERGHRQTGSRQAARDARIIELMVELTTRKKDRLQVDLAAVTVSCMNNPDGTPMFQAHDGGSRLSEEGVMSVWRRHKPAGWSRSGLSSRNIQADSVQRQGPQPLPFFFCTTCHSTNDSCQSTVASGGVLLWLYVSLHGRQTHRSACHEERNAGYCKEVSRHDRSGTVHGVCPVHPSEVESGGKG